MIQRFTENLEQGFVKSPLGVFVLYEDHNAALVKQISESNEIIFRTEENTTKELRERCIMATLSKYAEYNNIKEIIDYAEQLVQYILNGKQEERP